GLLVSCSLLTLPAPPPSSPLFPYTTLFRSPRGRRCRRGMGLRRPWLEDLRVLGPSGGAGDRVRAAQSCRRADGRRVHTRENAGRSEEHTSELQSRENLVCRLLLEKKKKENT